jgi:hypothetical protein
LAREPAEVNAVKKCAPLETTCEDINRILTPTVKQLVAETPVLNSDNKSEEISHIEVLGSKSPPNPQNDRKPDSLANEEAKDMIVDSGGKGK